MTQAAECVCSKDDSASVEQLAQADTRAMYRRVHRII